MNFSLRRQVIRTAFRHRHECVIIVGLRLAIEGKVLRLQGDDCLPITAERSAHRVPSGEREGKLRETGRDIHGLGVGRRCRDSDLRRS